MTLGEKFIFFYIPKTGSSFTIDVFKKINKKLNGVNRLRFFFKRKKLMTTTIKSPNIRDRFYNYKTDQHTTISQAFENQKDNRKIVSIIRNPVYGYISRYEYKSYANPKMLQINSYKNIIKNNYPNFPNLTFEEFIDFSSFITEDNLVNHLNVKPKIKLGALSVQFIQMFAYDPIEVLRIVDYDFFEKGYDKKYFPHVSFLNNENLTNELYSLLINFGYPKSLVNFMFGSKKKNVSVKKPYNDYLNNSTKREIYELEWFLFSFFKDRSKDWLEKIDFAVN